MSEKHTKTYKFTYENGSEFKLEQCLDEKCYKTIIEMQENGNIKNLFGKGIADSLKHFFKVVIDEIVKEMNKG